MLDSVNISKKTIVEMNTKSFVKIISLFQFKILHPLFKNLPIMAFMTEIDEQHYKPVLYIISEACF